MSTTQFLVTLAVVCAALVGYHVLFAPAPTPPPSSAPSGAHEASPPAPGLEGSSTAHALADLSRRVEALERHEAAANGSTSGSSKRELPADLDTFRTMLAAARQAEAEQRQREHFHNTVKRFAKGVAPAEIDAAVDVLARYYAGVRTTYRDAGTDIDAEARQALQRRVDDLQGQAEKELRAILGDEAAAALRRTMPGGTRGGIGAVSDPRKPPR